MRTRLQQDLEIEINEMGCPLSFRPIQASSFKVPLLLPFLGYHIGGSPLI